MYISEQSNLIQKDIRNVLDSSEYSVAAIELALSELSCFYCDAAREVSRAMPIKEIIRLSQSEMQSET